MESYYIACKSKLLIFFCFITFLTSTQAFAASASNPKMGMDASGNVVAVWQAIGDNSSVCAARLPYGGTWSTPVEISNAGVESTNPIIAVNSAGNAVAVWMVIDPTVEYRRIESAQLPFDGSWTTPVIVSELGDNTLKDYQLILNDTGYIELLWSGVESGSIVVHSTIGTFGGSWSTPVHISTP